VKLGNNANGVVVADGVRLLRVSVDGGDIIDNSITSADILNGTIRDYDVGDEPGVEWSNLGMHNAAGIAQCSSYSDLASITISAPTPGYIVVQASGVVNNTFAGNYWRVCLDDASGGNTCDGYSWIIESENTAYYKNEKMWHLQNVYSVGSGNKTIYLKACHSEFAGGRISWNRVIGAFYPTRY